MHMGTVRHWSAELCQGQSTLLCASTCVNSFVLRLWRPGCAAGEASQQVRLPCGPREARHAAAPMRTTAALPHEASHSRAVCCTAADAVWRAVSGLPTCTHHTAVLPTCTATLLLPQPARCTAVLPTCTAPLLLTQPARCTAAPPARPAARQACGVYCMYAANRSCLALLLATPLYALAVSTKYTQPAAVKHHSHPKPIFLSTLIAH